jgi:hypothetical protein
MYSIPIKTIRPCALQYDIPTLSEQRRSYWTISIAPSRSSIFAKNCTSVNVPSVMVFRNVLAWDLRLISKFNVLTGYDDN